MKGTTLLDVNVLLALAWPNHQHHQKAHQWFVEQSSQDWATCALTALAFVRLSSNRAYTADAVSPKDAAALFTRMTAHAQHRFWSELPPLDVEVFEHAIGHQQVMDAYLVKLARHHRGRLATFDTRVAAHAKQDGEVELISG